MNSIIWQKSAEYIAQGRNGPFFQTGIEITNMGNKISLIPQCTKGITYSVILHIPKDKINDFIKAIKRESQTQPLKIRRYNE